MPLYLDDILFVVLVFGLGALLVLALEIWERREVRKIELREEALARAVELERVWEAEVEAQQKERDDKIFEGVEKFYADNQ